jgi:4-hydroxy-4-methyl-2-oxoglutarate aldolase
MISAAEWAEYEKKLAGVVPKDRFVKVNFPRPSAELIGQLKSIEDPTPTLSDILDEMGIASTIPATILKTACAGKVVVGPALTLRYVPETKVPKQSMLDSAKGKLGDKDAYAVAKPGDVVIFDNGGRKNISTFGGLSARYAITAGIAGCIIDGGMRDLAEVRRLGFCAWSRGVTPITGKLRVECLEINGPVECAGVQVNPGDLVVADDNGVCFIPYNRIDDVYQAVLRAVKAEKDLTKALAGGKSMEEMRAIIPPEKW